MELFQLTSRYTSGKEGNWTDRSSQRCIFLLWRMSLLLRILHLETWMTGRRAVVGSTEKRVLVEVQGKHWINAKNQLTQLSCASLGYVHKRPRTRMAAVAL